MTGRMRRFRATKRPRAVLLFSAVLLLGSGVGAAGLDLGGTLANVTALEYRGAAEFGQWDKISLWLSAGTTPDFRFYAQGSYEFTIDRPYLFDLDALRFDFAPLPVLSFSLGRFEMAEFTGKVLRHTLDGALGIVNLPFAVISTGVGYSGLLLKPSSEIVMSRTDSADRDVDSKKLGSPRMVEALGVLFPELFLRQDLDLSAIFQQDLRKASDLIAEGEEVEFAGGLAGGRLNTQYFGVGVSGPLFPSFYHESFLYFQTGKMLSYVDDPLSGTLHSYQFQPIRSAAVGTSLYFYRQELLHSRFGLSALLAGGDADYGSFLEGNSAGSAGQFVPVSRSTEALIFTPELGNLLLLELGYSLKPFSRRPCRTWRNLQAELAAYVFLRPTPGPVSEEDVDPASTSRYLGSEVDAILRFRPFSDLGLGLTFGFFLPNPAAFTAPADRAWVQGRFELSFSV